MKEMNQGRGTSTISCGICRDLIPLVRDGVAASDSTEAVMAHIADCHDCRMELGGLDTGGFESPVPDDGKILRSVRKHLLMIALAFLGCGALLGISLTNTFGMFYNLLIMPLIGGFGYAMLRRRWYFAVAGIFGLTYVWQFVWSVTEGALTEGWRPVVFALPLSFSLTYSGLSALGVLIAALLHYAFRKET